MDNEIAFIIQARLGSTRLPNKMILPFWQNQSILKIIINKIKKHFPEIPIILATSIKPENQKLVEIAKDYNCLFFQGSEEDVLLRFINAASEFKKNKIIRICADNPFLDMNELMVLVKNIKNQDYLSFKVNNTPSIKTHFGFWAEFTTLQTLKTINSLTDKDYYHEHVTNYIYENPRKFNIKFLKPSYKLENYSDIRMTIDTHGDFTNLAEIYSQLHGRYKEEFGIKEILDFLDNTKGDYMKKMREEMIKNTK